jgi:hypothetical protein
MMGQSLTTYEIELAKSYIVWRSLIKAIKKDLNTISKGDLVFSSVYSAFIEGVLTHIEGELKKLSRYVIRVEKTDQPTVWEVNVGRRHGFIEVNSVEMMNQFEAYVIKSNGNGPHSR